MIRNVAILGATGSIGTQALDLVLAAPDRFVSHATIAQQTEECGLDSYGVTRSILARWAERKAGA